jgi:hypothetical protein
MTAPCHRLLLVPCVVLCHAMLCVDLSSFLPPALGVTCDPVIGTSGDVQYAHWSLNPECQQWSQRLK